MSQSDGHATLSVKRVLRLPGFTENIMRYSGNPSKLYVSGHSAGGHLTAMALVYDWEKRGLPRNLIKGGRGHFRRL